MNTKHPVEIAPLYLKHIDYSETHTDGSNEFIYSRFLVPYICNFSGKAIFMDGDMVVKGDIAELAEMCREDMPVAVAKHDYKTRHPIKYLGNRNEDYPRKNWSSVMVINCYHYAWRPLVPEMIAKATGQYLHRFDWIAGDRIADIPLEWNWLVEEYEHNDNAKLLHYTIGIPAFSEYVKCDHAEDWWKAYRATTRCHG